jgi:predicted outer membrane repeat protein
MKGNGKSEIQENENLQDSLTASAEISVAKTSRKGGTIMKRRMISISGLKRLKGFSSLAISGVLLLLLLLLVSATPALAASPPQYDGGLQEQRLSPSQAFTYTFNEACFTDSDGDSITYTATLSDGSSLPGWFLFHSESRTFDGTAPSFFTEFTVKVIAQAGDGSAAGTFLVTCKQRPIYIGGLTDQRCRPGESFSYSFSDDFWYEPDGDTITYEALLDNGDPLPDWFHFDSINREFFGTAPEELESFVVEVIGSDPEGSDSGYFLMTVALNSPPFYTGGLPELYFKTASSFTSVPFDATLFVDIDNDLLTYTATLADDSPLPSWIIFDGPNRVFYGVTGEGIETYTIKVTATDPYGASDFGTFSFHVVNELPNRFPVYNGTLEILVCHQLDTDYSFPLPVNTFTDPDGDTLTYSGLLANGLPLPPWINVDPDTGTIWGTTPIYETSAQIKITVEDGNGGYAYGFTDIYAVSSNSDPALYVDDTATGANDGTSWADAFNDLQDALAIAIYGDTIYVAEGTYTPGDLRTDTFDIPDGVTLLGGYPDGGGDRNPAANVTILSGDIGTTGDNSDNVHTIVSINSTTVTLDGFTISGGRNEQAQDVDALGGGMYASNGNVTLNNIVFSNNSVWWDSAAAARGGGMYVFGSDLELNDVTFDSNYAESGGAGAYIWECVNASFTNVKFLNNTANYDGAGAYFSASTATLNSVEFSNNQAGFMNDGGGGGGMLSHSSELTLNEVTFSENSASTSGGGMYGWNSTVIMSNVTISDNSVYGNDVRGGGLCLELESGNYANLTDVVIDWNLANGIDYGYGGGAFIWGTDSLTLNNVTISNNSASAYNEETSDGVAGGGGIIIDMPSDIDLTNVTISGNSVTSPVEAWGGGIVIAEIPEDRMVTLTNVTIVNNIVDGDETSGIEEGGGLYYVYPNYANAEVTYINIFNSILWGNTPDQLLSVDSYPGSSERNYFNADTCVIQDGYSVTNIITADPMLGTLGNYGGYTQTIPLLPGSSAIDMANGAYAPATDQRGVSRPQGDGDDIGAYEVEVTTGNIAPEIVSITQIPAEPTPVNGTVNMGATFTDPDPSDSHIATWDWDDGTDPTAGTVDGLTVSGDHIYSAAGVYTVGLTVTDAAGDSDTEEYQYVVVYDPGAGFVTGGGWIDSPEGAYVPDPDLSGKASFGFVSKYKKGATVPTGNTEFQFKAGDLNFHSSSYDWLVVTGADYANFKGTGTIDGLGSFKFKIWAGDGSDDTFRIKIWSEDEDGVEDVIYDNGTDQVIGGGNIVVHSN